MKRRKFIFATLAAIPAMARAKITPVAGMRTGRPFRVAFGEARFGTRYTMKGVTLNTLDIKISGSDTNQELAVFEQTGQTPYGGPPLHIHYDQDEWFFVTEGEYLFQCGEERFHMKSGDTIFLPRNVPHAFVQLTEKARTIVSYMPAGRMEAFFAATGKWESPPSKEEIARVFAIHGMKVVGEPLKPG
jgi:mannose-6-phosphate isomerase-like protein (cupin superfamily)